MHMFIMLITVSVKPLLPAPKHSFKNKHPQVISTAKLP